MRGLVLFALLVAAAHAITAHESLAMRQKCTNVCAEKQHHSSDAHECRETCMAAMHSDAVQSGLHRFATEFKERQATWVAPMGGGSQRKNPWLEAGKHK